MIRLQMKKVQYKIKREAAKISALSSGKIDKNEYLTGEEILLPDQQATYTCSLLEKALEKQTKAIEGQGEKQIKAIENKVEKTSRRNSSNN